MKIQKVTLLFATLISLNSLAETKSECHFSGTENIETIKIVSGEYNSSSGQFTKGHVEIVHDDGMIEKLSPQPFVEGSFNQLKYSNFISGPNLCSKDGPSQTKRTFVFVKSQILGEVKLSFAYKGFVRGFCEILSLETVADFNIHGKIYRFGADNPCTI